MKFSCTQENLSHGLSLVTRVASKQTNLPILQNVLLRAEGGIISLSATNLEIGIETQIRGKIDNEGSFTIPASLFQNYVSLLPSGRIDCVLDGNELHLTTQETRSRIKGEESTDFPILPQTEKEKVLSLPKNDLIQTLQQTLIAAAIDESRPEIAGIFFHTKGKSLLLAATDSYRLAQASIILPEESPIEIKAILPQRSASELLHLLQSLEAVEMIESCTTENQFIFWCDGTVFISRIIQGHFPDYEQIIPTEGATTARMNRMDWTRAIKGTALFSKTGVNDIEITFDPEKKVVALRANNIQIGENTTTIPAEAKGRLATVVFNYRFLIDGLNHINTDDVEVLVNDRNSPGLLRPADDSHRYVYIIMPIKQ